MKKLFIICISMGVLKGVQLVGTFWPDSTYGDAGVSVAHPAVYNIDGSGKVAIFAGRGGFYTPRNHGFYLGGADWDTLIDYEIPRNLMGPGYPGEALGYINNDSFPDLVSAHPYWDSTILRVWYGGPGFDSLPDFETVIYINQNNVGLGYSVATGDLNGDGYDEVILSGPGVSVNYSGEGGFAVFLGGPYWDGNYDFLVLGGAESARFAGTVATGDVTGDGKEDLLVGVHDAVIPPSFKVRVYPGSDPLNFDFYYELNIIGRVYPSSAKGDFNGDGYNDIIVRDTNWSYPGGSIPYFFLGGDPLDPNPDFTTNVYAEGIGIIKDLNGDLYDELVLGCPGFECAYIYYGKDGVPTNYDESVVPPDYPYPGEYHLFGKFVASAGDFTGDGVFDLVVSAPTPYQIGQGEFTAGRAYLYAGETGIKESGEKTVQGVRVYYFSNGIRIKGIKGELKIFDISGRLIKKFKGENIFWDYRDLKGNRVKKGMYILKFDGKKKVLKIK